MNAELSAVVDYMERERGVDRVADKAEDHRRAVTHAVDDEAEENNGNGKRPDAGSEKLLRLDLVEPEVGGPERGVVDEEGARDERERGGDKGDEAAPEKLLVFVVCHGEGG